MRALIYLSRNRDRGLIPAREIAASWHVPVKYLEQILKALREAGIVEGQVGAGGGYRLSRPPEFTTAGEVIRVLDGRLAPMGCVSSHQYVPCEFEPTCGLKTLWARTRSAVLGVLDHTTIADVSSPASHPPVGIGPKLYPIERSA